MKVYGFYIGFDFVSVAVRDTDSAKTLPLFIYPLERTADRQQEVKAAFGKIISDKIISHKKSSATLLSFESPENQLFITNIAKETLDINEMASWELFMRVGDVKNYNISAHKIKNNKYLVAAAKKHDIDFYTKQINRLGLKISVIEPPLVCAINLFEMNYDTKGENLIALLSFNKITIAYMKNNELIDIAQNSVHSLELISSEDVMKVRAEITQRNGISNKAQMFITGDLPADRKYSDNILEDMKNCEYLAPFKIIKIDDEANKELMSKYSFAFGISTSLSKKMG